MKLLLLTFVISLLLDERGCPLAYDQSTQELTAPHRHHHPHQHHQRQRHNAAMQLQQQQMQQQQQQQSTAHHKRHHHQAYNYENNNNSNNNHINSNSNNNFNYSKIHNTAATTATTKAHSKHLHSTTSSPTTTAKSHRQQHHQHQQQQQQSEFYVHHQQQQHHHHNPPHQHYHHQHRSSHERFLDDYRAPKSINTDAISQQNFKFTPQNNRIDVEQQDLHFARAAAPSPSSSSISTENDDYIYDEDSIGNSNDDVEVDGNSRGNFISGDAGFYQTKHQHHQHQYQPFTDGAYRDHEYPRVTRDQSRIIANQQQLQQHDKEYTADEAQRPNTDEDGSSRSGTPGVLTKQKFDELGTPEAVQKTRERFMQEQARQKTPRELASDHLRRMNIATRCKYPLPRVVHVSNDTAKTYRPKAVILHRCGEDTGCCTAGQICTVKATQNVTLYFFVVNLANELTTEQLTLTNHTECECVDPRVLMQQRAKRSGRHHSTSAAATLRYSGTGNIDDDVDYESSSDVESAANAICRCPKHFDILREDIRPAASSSASALPMQHYSTRPPPTTCRCDCRNTNTPCQRLKDGGEGFSILDRKCIDERRCVVPTCSFGEYNSLQGRCPSSYKRSISTYNDLGSG